MREDEPGYWIQVIASGSRTIDRFAPISDEEVGLISRQVAIPVRLGGVYVHAFIDRSGGLHLDRAENLKTQFNIAISHPDTSMPVRLAIAECMTDVDRARRQRDALHKEFLNRLGQRAATSFLNSAATGQLWGLLERHAISSDARGRIRACRSRITAEVSSDGISVDLSAVRLEDLNIDFSEIGPRLTQAFGYGAYASPQVADLSGLPFSETPTGMTIVSAVERSPRQEERLSILLRAAILYPSAFRSAISQYSDPAFMTNQALRLLRGGFVDELSDIEARRVAQVAAIVPKLFSMAYPRRRGAMLYYMAVHLGDHAPIAKTIYELAARSVARDIDLVRPRIIEMFEDWGRQLSGYGFLPPQ
ncbi:hypothetical protein DDF65_15475 [Caulobacter radicis]|uniref:Uncharacterized protein n=2 Tax=Caulobacter radicis TaxID=2172650 RepID=A0A2T9J9E5_9CAUL|nr:hypothetical protein DDF65_15475 [Caulobacter radicis]